MDFNKEILVLFFIMAISEISAQFLIKKGANHPDDFNIFVILGILCIMITYILLYFIMKTGKHLSVISAIHHTSIVIVIALGSFFIFSQKLNKTQLFALSLIIIGTFLLTLQDTDHSH